MHTHPSIALNISHRRRGLPLRLSEAQGCSHGWSDAALSVAEPVEAGAPLHSFFCLSRLDEAEKSSVLRRMEHTHEPFRPRRVGELVVPPSHELRPPSAAFTRGDTLAPRRGESMRTAAAPGRTK